jgi:antitoxin HicB
MNRGDTITHDSTRKARQVLVPVPAEMAVKAALYIAVKEADICNSELAKRLAADEKEICRPLDPHHRSKLPKLEAALEAMGKKLVIGIETPA